MDEWQFSCCGDPFAVGDEVAWTLVLRPASGPTAHLGASVELAAHGRESAEASWVGGPGVVAAWLGGPPLHVGERVRGVLHEDRHGDAPADLPRTRGTVRRIRVVTVLLERAGEREWRRRDAAPGLRDVERLPTPLRHAEREAASGPVEDDSAFLVELDLPG